MQIVLYLGNSTHLLKKCECIHPFQNLLSFIFGLFGTFHINCKEHMKVRSSYFLHNFCLFDHTTRSSGSTLFLFVSLYFSNLGHNPFNGHSLLSSHNFFFTFCTFFLLCVVMIITYAKWFKKWRIINYNELKRIHLESLLILIRIISKL